LGTGFAKPGGGRGQPERLSAEVVQR
jgi:hypothetical protein